MSPNRHIKRAARRRKALPARGSIMLHGLLCAVLLSACAPHEMAAPFHNPLNAVNGADPWLTFYEGNYYLTATRWSSIRMWRSPTLAGLAAVEPVTIWSDPTPSHCCNVWAPEFHLLDGPNGPHWYLYYTAGTDGTLDNQRMHVLESSGIDPLGPYTSKRRIYDPSADGWAIDGSVLTMPDVKQYYLFSAWEGSDQNLFIAPISDPWTISDQRARISTPTYAWERSLANVNEGAEALQHDGKTFIIYSASACWGPDYKLGMLSYTGGDVLDADSWAKHPEPVFQRSDANGVFALGHNGFFTSADGTEHWIVYHANSSPSDGCTGECTTRVQRFTWNEDGTPNFGTPVVLDTTIAPPSGERGAAPPPASPVLYTIVGDESGQCLAVPVNEQDGAVQQQDCDDGACQQWSIRYLGNGYYQLQSRDADAVLTVVEGVDATHDGTALEAATWEHGAHQQWRFLTAGDGWLQIESRHSGKVVATGGCGANSSATVQQQTRSDSPCQLFRLQPVGPVGLVNAHSEKMVAVDQVSTAEHANVLLWSEAEADEQRWRFEHQDQGFYQIRAGHSDKCLSAGGAGTPGGQNVDQRSCAGAAEQQWRIEPLNDGMIRLVARRGGLVLDASNCRMADGTNLQVWAWLDNLCQHFRIVAP